MRANLSLALPRSLSSTDWALPTGLLLICWKEAFLSHVFQVFRNGFATQSKAHYYAGLSLALSCQLKEPKNELVVEARGRRWPAHLQSTGSNAADPRPRHPPPSHPRPCTWRSSGKIDHFLREEIVHPAIHTLLSSKVLPPTSPPSSLQVWRWNTAAAAAILSVSSASRQEEPLRILGFVVLLGSHAWPLTICTAVISPLFSRRMLDFHQILYLKLNFWEDLQMSKNEGLI